MQATALSSGNKRLTSVVGKVEGRAVLGPAVGFKEDAGLGCSDGGHDGRLDGPAEGALDGVVFGINEGIPLGEPLGKTVGVREGDWDG